MAKKFQKVNIEITNICNLQCSFCPEVIRTKKMMDVELFRRVCEEVSPLTDMVTFHLMGDPLLHPKLAELVEICHEKGLRIFFVTNGVLLRENEIETLLHPAFRQVNFSLHSFADNFGDKDNTDYLEKIFRFTERAMLERPDLYINYRLWNLNDPRGTQTNNRQILSKIEERFQVKVPTDLDTRVKKSWVVKKPLSLHFDTEFIWPGVDLPILGERGTCYGLKSHFGILANGTVVPCCLDKEGVIALGNIGTTPIKEILNTERSQNMLSGFRNKKLVEDLCKRCQYIERFKSVIQFI